MAALNLCDCGKNFSSSSGHASHRTGKFGVDRRCLTSEELLALHWTVATEPVQRLRDGKDYVDHLETWTMPVDEKARAYFAALKAQRAQASEGEPEEELV